MRENLSKGGELARGLIATLFPNGIWMQRDPSGAYLWAVFADGMGAALFDQVDIAESFPILSENSMVARVRLWCCFLRIPRHRAR